MFTSSTEHSDRVSLSKTLFNASYTDYGDGFGYLTASRTFLRRVTLFSEVLPVCHFEKNVLLVAQYISTQCIT